MNRSNRSLRTPRTLARSGAAALALAAGLASPALADVYSWYTGNGAWGSASNWWPNAVPAQNSDIWIGNLPIAFNATVAMGGGVATFNFGELQLTDGMTLDMNGSELISAGEAWITGANSRLIARPAPFLNARDFQGNVRVGAGAYLELRDNVQVWLGSTGWSEGTISGRGNMLVTGGFRNDGVIDPDAIGGLTLDAGAGSVDIDGTSGDGHLLLDTASSQLVVQAQSLADQFSGVITMAPGSVLTMDVAQGWAADATSTISVFGSGVPASVSRITGNPVTFRGPVNLTGNEPHLRVQAPATVEGTTDVMMAAAGWIEFDGVTTVEDALFVMGLGARIDFDGAATVEGGTFVMEGPTLAHGSVDFNGPTTWAGNVTIQGVGRQVGAATVTGPTVITAGRFAMDGDGATVWNINDPLTVTADALRSNGGQGFFGTLNIAGGLVGSLTMTNTWICQGAINLTGDAGLFPVRLGGAAAHIYGPVSLPSGRAQVSAPVTLYPSANISIGAASAVLRVVSATHVPAGATFSGAGTLRNGAAGSLNLAANADLATVGIQNDGVLTIGTTLSPSAVGVARADRLTSSPGSSWTVGIGGTTPGTQHDKLLLNGAAALGGALSVELVDLGAGAYVPTVGDEFTILLAPGGVSGTFETANPKTQVGDVTYDWQVVYNPSTVVLRLANIVTPCYANCDGSTAAPILNVADFTCYLNKFASGTAWANCDGSTAAPVLNFADFSCFLQKFAAGCP